MTQRGENEGSKRNPEGIGKCPGRSHPDDKLGHGCKYLGRGCVRTGGERTAGDNVASAPRRVTSRWRSSGRS